MRQKSFKFRIFPYDGMIRIRFTGRRDQAPSQPDASGSPKKICFAIWGYYTVQEWDCQEKIRLPFESNVINLGVGNAVPGVPSGAVHKHRARKPYRIAAFGGRNAEDGVPYGCLS